LGLDGGLSGCFSSACSTAKDWYQSCEDYVLGWGDAGGMLWDWVTGGGEDNRNFDGNDRFTRLMRNDGCVQEAIEFWRQKNKGKTCCDKLLPVTRYDCKFRLPELIGAGINPAQQFIGTYKVDILPSSDATVTIILNNTTSTTSATYGVVPDWERSTFGPCGNMRQTYTWTESCFDLLQ
jgi:hypothetical protein